MIIAALTAAAALALPPVQFAQPEPDRIGNGCGFLPGSTRMIPVLYAVFYGDDAPAYVDENGVAYSTRLGWGSLADTPFTSALDRDWFVGNEEITINGATYAKWGLPRVYGFDELAFLAEHDRVGVFRDAGDDDAGETPDRIFVMLRPAGCELQPYQRR